MGVCVSADDPKTHVPLANRISRKVDGSSRALKERQDKGKEAQEGLQIIRGIPLALLRPSQASCPVPGFPLEP